MNGDALVKSTTKIMFGDAGVSGTAQYMSQLIWILFLKVFDAKEEEWELKKNYVPVIPEGFRFRDWADLRKDDGSKDLTNRLTGDKLIKFAKSKKITNPVVVVPMDIRHMVFVIMSEFVPNLTVLAHEELVSDLDIKFVGKV